MPRDWFRFDPTTLLATLLAGLLPSGLLVLISLLCLNSITLPLLDLYDTPYRDRLQERCEKIRDRVVHRLAQLSTSIERALGDNPEGATEGDWDLVQSLRWYPRQSGASAVRFSEDEVAQGEALIAQLADARDPTSRAKAIDAVASLPKSLLDPVGYSYAVEAQLLEPGPLTAEMQLEILRAGDSLDAASLEAVLDANRGNEFRVPEVPTSIAVMRGPTPRILGECDIDPDNPDLLRYAFDHPGGTYVAELLVRPFLERTLNDVKRSGRDGMSSRLVPNSRASPDSEFAAIHVDPNSIHWPLSEPFGTYWNLATPIDETPLAVTILRRLKNFHYLWGGVVILALGTVASFFLAGVVSRRVQMSRRKDDFLRLVSHELRTPIASIRVLAETVGMDRFRNEEERREFLLQLERESARLSDLVDRVIEFGRADCGQGVREMVTDPGELVEEAVSRFRERDEDREVTVRAAQEFHPLLVDREAIIGVVLNLLTNAAKFSPDDLAIDVTVGEESRRLFIEVRDRGTGIRRREHRKIFRPFYRGPQAGKTPGFGLGLAYCREVARAHRGRIRVESSPGQGSAFTLEVPRVSAGEKGAGLGDYSGR